MISSTRAARRLLFNPTFQSQRCSGNARRITSVKSAKSNATIVKHQHDIYTNRRCYISKNLGLDPLITDEGKDMIINSLRSFQSLNSTQD
jgi:hypothetical protein